MVLKIPFPSGSEGSTPSSGTKSNQSLSRIAAARRGISHAVRSHNAVLDGEICCLEPDGRTAFNMQSTGRPRCRPSTLVDYGGA